LEQWTSSINGNGNWSLRNSFGEGLWVIDSNIIVTGNLNSTGGFLGTLTISSLVWVFSLGLNSNFLSMHESIVHEATLATLIALLCGAVNELLLREGDKALVFDEVFTFHRASGGEGPA
jgi:hypothetical protein